MLEEQKGSAIETRKITNLIEEQNKLIQEASEIVFSIKDKTETLVGSVPSDHEDHAKIAEPSSLKDAMNYNIKQTMILVRRLQYINERLHEEV